MWDVKESTLLFEKSRGCRPWWCGQPLRIVGLGRDGTLHGTYESRSCPFPLGRPVSRKAGKTKKKLKKLNQKLIRVHFVADSFRPRCLGNGKRFFLRDFPFTKTRWCISLFIRWLNSSFNNREQSHALCWCCVLFVRIACAQPHPSYSGCRRLFIRGFRFRSSLNHDPREKVKDERKN